MEFASASAKISDLIAAQTGPFLSAEFFPPKTAQGVESLDKVIEKIKLLGPLFIDFTWGAGGTTSDLTVELCLKAKKDHGCTTNMHLTCTNMEAEKVRVALGKCLEAGMTNILALRGDPPVGQAKWVASDSDFACALDLVRHIQTNFGEYFCVSCAGYPEGHPDSMTRVDNLSDLSPTELKRCNEEVGESGEKFYNVCRDADFEKELLYLKEKVDAGAAFVVTQMIFDSEVYDIFVKRCREIGINVPIVPGLMCISTYGGFKRMTKFCKSRVPQAFLERFEAIKDDEHAVKELGVQIGFEICKALLEFGAPGIHFYTLNLANTTTAIVHKLREEGLLPPVVDIDAVARVAEALIVQSAELHVNQSALA